MTDNAIVAWDPNSGAALPAYLSDAMGALGTNIADRMTVPSLSYEGKTWAIVKDGNKTKLQAANSDGDMIPIPIMRMVILNYNSDRGRAFYPGVYNPAESKQPDCWSADGKTPDPSAKARQWTSCAGCPQSVKGSKVQDGKEMIACGSHRMIAIAPAFDIGGDPLRLKIAVTSDYDKEVVEHGWFAFRQYTDYLKSRGITHTGLVVTKVKFDNNTAYPKLLFALDRLLTPDEVEQVLAASKNPKVAELLAEKWSAAGTQGVPVDDSDIKPFGLEGAYADGWKAHPDAAGYSYKDQEVVANADLAARYPAPAPAPVEAPTPAVPASQQVIEGTVRESPEKTPAEKAAADGWIDHPASPPHMYRGEEVLTREDVLARYATPNATPNAPAVVEPVVPASPPPVAATTAPVAPNPPSDPLVAARADGWLPHPGAPGYHYKDQEVVADGDLAGRYPSAVAGTPTTAAPTAAPTAPPSDTTIPADVQQLLDKWQ